MPLTAIHCLSSTWPSCLAEAWFGGSSGTPPLPFTQCWPMSSEKETSISPLGCSVDFPQNALNGSVVWYTRPLVSNATFGSVTSVQLGGIACVPAETQSYPCTWLSVIGSPGTMRYE